MSVSSEGRGVEGGGIPGIAKAIGWLVADVEEVEKGFFRLSDAVRLVAKEEGGR